MHITLRLAGPAELVWINGCYRDIDFRLSAADDVQVVAEADGRPAGLGRIVPVGARAGELGGMVVFEQFRGAGVSRRIIGALMATAEFDFLYCLPFANLEGLYASFGFRRMDGAGVAKKVIEKHQWCQRSYAEPVLLMGLRLDTVTPPRQQYCARPEGCWARRRPDWPCLFACQ